ncbi:hypothetical protein K503DRAFT_864697 [Rhizopogon vinicolor AM-OR11-026]|uniref:Uncharacterized protein n=1 Tax=Rhizopogon vinicolor AM-OR11-026 TaxID=1314800 RepID=A0A1B7N667_9AGAM|nr:hypothetical protein K503DRAFT_864697 [Rhizopogon vinicolor AM-OR11-026]
MASTASTSESHPQNLPSEPSTSSHPLGYLPPPHFMHPSSHTGLSNPASGPPHLLAQPGIHHGLHNPSMYQYPPPHLFAQQYFTQQPSIHGTIAHRVYELPLHAGEVIPAIASHSALAAIASPSILASASYDDPARMWDLEDGQPIASPLQHADRVRCVSFSIDGKILATGCDDNNAYTWNIPAIVREAGLYELLLNPNVGHKSLLEMLHDARLSGAGVTILIPIDLYPQDFGTTHLVILPPLEDILYPPLPHANIMSPCIYHQMDAKSFGRLFSLLWRNNYTTHDTPPRPRFLQRVRNSFSVTPRRRNDEGVELQERRPTAAAHSMYYLCRRPCLLTSAPGEI